MKTDEKKFQTQLVDTCRAVGGWGRKMQRAFVKGWPDVDLKHPRFSESHVEVKHVVYTKMPVEIQVETTALQRRELRLMRSAGINAGWCVFVTIGTKHYYVTSMGQIYAKRVVMPKQLQLWDKSENALLTILQSL